MELYCKRRKIVLQYRVCCGKKIVLQEKGKCIAIGRLVVEPLYCNTRVLLQLGCVVAGFVLPEEATEDCIAIQLLYCHLGRLQ